MPLPTRSVFPGFPPWDHLLGCPLQTRLTGGTRPTPSWGGRPESRPHPFPPHPPPERRRRRRRLRWLHPLDSVTSTNKESRATSTIPAPFRPGAAEASGITSPELSSPSSASLPGGFFLELLVFPHFFRVFVLRDRGGGRGRRRKGEEEEGEERGTRVSRIPGFRDPHGSGRGSKARGSSRGTPRTGRQRPLLPRGHF